MRFDWIIFALVNAWVRVRYPLVWLFQLRRTLGPRNVAVPRSVNEKYWWRKLFDRDPRFVVISDKIRVKTWVRDICPDVDAPRTLWVGKRVEDIPDSVLAGNVVIKTNDASATNFFILDGEFDRAKLVETVNRWFCMPAHGRHRGEWAYSEIERLIFVEELLLEKDAPVFECKFSVFGGTAYWAKMIINRLGEDRQCRYRRQPGDGFVAVPQLPGNTDNQSPDIPLPGNFARMLAAAETIGREIDQVRVDFYSDGKTVWIGELTLYHMGGRLPRFGDDRDDIMAKSWDLRHSDFLSNPPQHGWRAIYARALSRHLDAELSG